MPEIGTFAFGREANEGVEISGRDRSSIGVRLSPGEVKISSRIKVPPPLPRSRDFLPSGGRFEIDQCCQRCGWEGKKFPWLEGNFRFVG